MAGRKLTVAACLVAAAMAVGACSSDEGAGAAQEGAPEPEEASAPRICPLTGGKPKGIDRARPAVAVKVENSPEAQPQSGLGRADVVYEEIVEGGITRFMAIYHCGEAGRIGPIRSARFDDPKIMLPYTRVLAYSGGNQIVEGELAKNKVVRVSEEKSKGVLFRDPPGSTSTHSVYTKSKDVRKYAVRKAKGLEAPPGGFFEFGPQAGGGARARRVTLNFNPGIAIEWRWQKGEWRRYERGAPFESATGPQISTQNLLVQEVEVNNSKTLVDVAGNASPDITLQGKGRALLFRDGKVTKGTWRTTRGGKQTRFETTSGDAFTFDVGSTWVELVPSKKGEVKGSVKFSKR